MAGTIVADTVQNGSGSSTSMTNVVNGCAKAWVSFAGSTGTVNGSYNVSSVTRNSTGQYTVNISSALTDANYAVVVSATQAVGGTGNSTTDLGAYQGIGTAITSSSFQIYVGLGGWSAYADATVVCGVCFR